MNDITPNTALAVYDRVTDVPAFIEQFGKVIAGSAMFGCENPNQGKVLAMECMARGLAPLALAEQYDIIKNRLSMKASAMLGNFCRLGGRHHIIERSADRAAIELTYGSEVQEFSLSWEEARLEPFIYAGKEADIVAKLANGKMPTKIKPKYATPRSRLQMLWARCISDAVRAMTPEIVAGVYTPEEIHDAPGCEAVPSNSSSEPDDDDGDEIDASFTVVSDETVEPEATEAEPDTRTSSGPNDRCGQEQAKEIWAFAKWLKMTDAQVKKACQKRGAESIPDLTLTNADELLGTLEGLKLNKDAAQVFQSGRK